MLGEESPQVSPDFPRIVGRLEGMDSESLHTGVMRKTDAQCKGWRSFVLLLGSMANPEESELWAIS